MIYKAYERKEVLQPLERELKEKGFSVVSIEKNENKDTVVYILTVSKENKFFKISIVERKGQTVISIVFPKGVGFDKEKEILKEILDKL